MCQYIYLKDIIYGFYYIYIIHIIKYLKLQTTLSKMYPYTCINIDKLL